MSAFRNLFRKKGSGGSGEPPRPPGDKISQKVVDDWVIFDFIPPAVSQMIETFVETVAENAGAREYALGIFTRRGMNRDVAIAFCDNGELPLDNADRITLRNCIVMEASTSDGSQMHEAELEILTTAMAFAAMAEHMSNEGWWDWGTKTGHGL